MKDVGFSWIFITKTTHQKTTVTDEEVECDATTDKMNFGFFICKLPRYLHPPKAKHGTRFSQNLKERIYFILFYSPHFFVILVAIIGFFGHHFPKTPSFF